MGSWLSHEKTDEERVHIALKARSQGSIAFTDAVFELFLLKKLEDKAQIIMDNAVAGTTKTSHTFYLDTPALRQLYAAVIEQQMRNNVFVIQLQRRIQQLFSDIEHESHIVINEQKLVITINVLEKF